MKKYTYEQVRKMFEDAGCILISTTYVNSSEPLEYYCSCNNTIIETIKLNSFMMGCRCPKCREKRLKATMMERHGVTHISQIPEKKEQMVRGMKEYVENKKHTIEDLQEYFEKEGCVLLSTEYTDNKAELDVRFKCGCTGTTTFNQFQKGHRCSNNECMTLKKKETSMELFGKEWYAQTVECQEQIKATCQRKYGVDHYRQTTECEERIKNTNLAIYGKEYFFQTDIFKEKKKKRCMDDFGVEYYSQVEFVKEKIVDTNMKKYGVPVSSQNEEVKNKIIKTHMERYGFRSALLNDDIKSKTLKTILDIYGVDNVSKNPYIQDLKIKTCWDRYNVPFAMQNPIIYERSRKNAHALKEYIFPSGREEVVQGYTLTGEF